MCACTHNNISGNATRVSVYTHLDVVVNTQHKHPFTIIYEIYDPSVKYVNLEKNLII